MVDYQHYSFDLWLTLIKSNPVYKKERAKYFQKNYNFEKKSFRSIEDAFRMVDLMAGAVNEKTGKNLDADELYSMVICQLNQDRQVLQDADMKAILSAMDQLVFEFSPLLYCSATMPVLQFLKNKTCGISLLSNTGFIRGELLRKVLAELGLAPFFDFQLYSDEQEMSKPNALLYQKMIEKVHNLRPGLEPEQIIHIGDNQLADLQAARTAGIQSLLINSNNRCIKTLLS